MPLKAEGRRYSGPEETRLMSEIWDPQIAENPYNFAMFAYPWGKENTPLVGQKGPRKWQREEFEGVADHIVSNKERLKRGLPLKVYKNCIGSGRGIGKSAFLGIMNHWFMSCVVGGTATTTSNTEDQLRTKTWPEQKKWLNMAINSHWFEETKLTFYPSGWYRDALKSDLKLDPSYYIAIAQTWSRDNPDSFAGTHNMIGMLLMMDESSGIDERIWKVSEGFFTEMTIHRYWFALGNIRRTTGRFHSILYINKGTWKRRRIDARDVEEVDKEVIKSIIADYGADSDEAKVEVYGQRPEVGEDQFISRWEVKDAYDREIPGLDTSADALIMGVDPARGGRGKTVVRFRRGRDGRSFPFYEYDFNDKMKIVRALMFLIEKHNPDGIAIDAGHGTGIIDRMRELGVKVHEVWFSAKLKHKVYENRRMLMWAKMKDWLRCGMIDGHDELREGMVGPMQVEVANSDKKRLESKRDMLKRGLKSPDHADALALTFAINPLRKDRPASRWNTANAPKAKGLSGGRFGGSTIIGLSKGDKKWH